MSSLGIRARLFIAAVASVTVAVFILVVVFNVVLARRLSSDVDSLLHARANAELSAVRIKGGRPVIAESPDGAAAVSPIWVFAGRTPIEVPRAPAEIDRWARLMARQPVGIRDVPGAETRLLSVAVADGDRRVGTVIAAASLDPYRDTQRAVLLGSVVMGAALVLAFALSTGWILRRALQPVSRMTADAAEWSEHDLDRRFELGPPKDELTQLGATLDDLLDRLAAGLRREQRLTAEISHELRTPLARIQAESDLVLRRERSSAEYSAALASISQNARRMAAIIATLLDAARQEASPASATCDVRTAAQAVVTACAPVAEAHSIDVELASSPTPARARVDQALAEGILQPLLENACRHARAHVTVTIDAVDGRVRVTVADDGPGIGEHEVETVFEPGARGAGSGGAGLGLSLARRLARAGNGDVVARGGAPGTFVVVLPSATTPAQPPGQKGHRLLHQ